MTQDKATIQLSKTADFRTLVWTVSHHSLLIRADKGEHGQNIDLMFAGVFYVQIPVWFHGLELGIATPEEVAYLQRQCQEEDADRTAAAFHVLCSEGKRYYVGASHIWVERNLLSGTEHNLLA